ncbi:metal ABC transporter substrate-binding protein [Patescibacteria group bacterium]|nr:metal ABC transporter substrate-binding protein [Patescibacteria group bacterium]
MSKTSFPITLKRLILAASVLGLFILAGYLLRHRIRTQQSNRQSHRLKIVASFYPLYFFTSQIAGDNADVTDLVPAGAEPHDYEPTVGDIVNIDNSDVLVINGAGLEPWADRLHQELTDRKIAVVAAGQPLADLSLKEDGRSQTDPHVWLDPVLAQQEVNLIAKALMARDPNHRSQYESNRMALVQKLEQLNRDFKQGLAHCQQKDVITSHAAFGYLARRYGLTQVAIQGINPDQEPSPRQLAQIVNLAKREKIRYIFFETLVSPRLADTLAREVGAKTLVFNPLEGLTQTEQATGLNYFTVQQNNLSHLRTALQCRQ